MGENVIKKTDYEFYSIDLPYSLISKNVPKRLVAQELEKRHPCFSRRFITEINYKFRKKYLTAEVAVIDKLKFSEYEKNAGHKRLYLENHKNFFLITGNTRKLMGMILVLILLSLLMIFFLAGRTERGNVSADVNIKEDKIMDVNELPEAGEICDLILARVYQARGRILEMSYENNSCSFQIAGCHPEEIVFDSSCSVSYAKGEPHFSVRLKAASKKIGYLEQSCNVTDFQGEMRAVLKENGVLIEKEKLSSVNSEISFFCGYDHLRNALSGIEAVLERNSWHESGITVQGKANGCAVAVKFEKGLRFSESVLDYLISYVQLFRADEDLPLAKRAFSGERNGAQSHEKIGAIRRGDGTSVIFWKSPDGKIVSERRSGE